MPPEEKVNQNQSHDLQAHAADEEAVKLLLRDRESGKQPE
jgi:hypothetical protein